MDDLHIPTIKGSIEVNEAQSEEWPEHTALMGQGEGACVMINVGGRSPDWVIRMIMLGQAQQLIAYMSRLAVGYKLN